MGKLAENSGARLRELREQAGLTQDALADQVGLTGGQISKLERGHQFGSETTYTKAIEALSVALSQEPEIIQAYIFGGGPALGKNWDGLPITAEGLRAAERIKRLRGNRNFGDLAREAQLSAIEWGWYEAGVTAPSPEVAGSMAEALGCDIEDILGYDPTKQAVFEKGISEGERRALEQSQVLLKAAAERERSLMDEREMLLEERGRLLGEIRQLRQKLGQR